MGIQARLAAHPHYQHVMTLSDMDRYPGSSTLSLIDGAILGCGLTCNEEHSYRMAHHTDVDLVAIVAHLWRGPYPLIRSITVLKD